MNSLYVDGGFHSLLPLSHPPSLSVCGWKHQICHFPNKKRMKGPQRACCSHIKPHDVTLPHTHVQLAVRPSHTISLTRCQAARRNHPCRAGVRKCVIPEIICCRWMISCRSIRHGVKNQIRFQWSLWCFCQKRGFFLTVGSQKTNSFFAVYLFVR